MDSQLIARFRRNFISCWQIIVYYKLAQFVQDIPVQKLHFTYCTCTVLYVCFVRTLSSQNHPYYHIISTGLTRLDPYYYHIVVTSLTTPDPNYYHTIPTSLTTQPS